jgi:mannose-6-phosphate isomerase-like protein (cupin superfamily)
MTNEEIIASILEHKKNKKVAVFKNFFDNTPSWDDFIKYIDESSKQESVIGELTDYDISIGSKVIGNLLIKQDLYIYIPIHRHIGESEKIVDIFKTLNPKFNIRNIYINLSDIVDDVETHHDKGDNFYWQCQGSVEWVGNGQTYKIDKGDLVFIPMDTDHGVNFLEPRAAIGFSTRILPELYS